MYVRQKKKQRDETSSKLKPLCLKGHHGESKQTMQGTGEQICKSYLIRGLYKVKVYKELLKLNDKKINNPILKMGKRPEQIFPQEMANKHLKRWLTSSVIREM